jgi:osomolarity two-component system, sensor histidine kinase SLN1
MPHRSRTSLASGTGSSTRLNSSNGQAVSQFSMEKMPPDSTISQNGGGNEPGLPPPVQQTSSFNFRGTKKARIDTGIKRNMRVHWDRLLRKMGNGTAPSSSSAHDESTTGESSGYRHRPTTLTSEEDEWVDEVVVDREWAEELKSTSITHSEHVGTPERGGSNMMGGTSTDRESLAMHVEGFWSSCTPLIWLRWRLWPFLFGFFYTRFLDEKSEEHYNKENWFMRKVCILSTPP